VGVFNADKIVTFPCIILDDFFNPFMKFFESEKVGESHYVLIDYHVILSKI